MKKCTDVGSRYFCGMGLWIWDNCSDCHLFYSLVSNLPNKSIRHALGSPKSGGGFVWLMQFKICGKNCKRKFLDFLHLCSCLVYIVGKWSWVWKIVSCICIGSFLVVYCFVIYLEYYCEISRGIFISYIEGFGSSFMHRL